MVKYDRVTVHFKEDREPMVVSEVVELAKSHFPGSGDTALQIIDAPSSAEKIPILGRGLFNLDLNLVRPWNVDYIVLEKESSKKAVEVEDIFDRWEWEEPE